MRQLFVCLATVAFLGGTSTLASDFWKLFSCSRGVEGSGDLVTETRDLKDFSRIESTGSFDIYVQVGEDQRVAVNFDDNLVDLVETRVRGKTLKIHSRESFSSQHPCRVDISVPSLESVKLSGSGDIEVINLDGDFFEFALSGSGDMRAEGRVEEVDIRVSGSGDVDTRDLVSKEARVKVSGSGDVKAHATENFYARVSGSGDIDIYGNPEHVSRHVSGSGDVRKRR